MADHDLSRYRIMASYILTVNMLAVSLYTSSEPDLIVGTWMTHTVPVKLVFELASFSNYQVPGSNRHVAD